MPEYICTMGPSINNLEKLLELYDLGLRTVRFNMSHIDYDILEVMQMLKDVEEIKGGKIQTLIDTCGPEIRINISNTKEVHVNEIIILGEDFDLSVSYNNILEVGDILRIDDGKLSLKVVKKQENLLYCLAQNTGILKNRAGVNSNKLLNHLSFMSDRDLDDIRFAFDNNFDWIALSFVSSKDDLLEVLEIKNEYPNCKTKIMAKIETIDAVKNIDKIILLCDSVMIARGDLGVAFPIHKIAALQNYISQKVLLANKKVVVGTGFLRSMKTKTIPERSEIMDLYYTFLNNTNTIMFSGETAIAENPANILKMANFIYETTNMKDLDLLN